MGAMQQMLLAAGGLRATISPASITESVGGPSPGTILTAGSATITVTGGSGTYTYSTALSSQIGSFTLAVASPANSSTLFKMVAASLGDVGEADAICTVTDTVTTLTAVTGICHVKLTHA